MGEPSLFLVEQRGFVRRITISRPDKLNALTPAMEEELFHQLDRALADDGTRVIVLAGAGRAFSSGADVGSGGGASSAYVLPPDPARDMDRNRQRVERWLQLWSAPKPLIAQVQGYCLGIANELAACCDLVICGESARFGMPEARRFGLPPTLAFWPARIGLQRSKELLFTGRLVTGEEAVESGMAARVVPDAELTARVDELADEIAEVDARLLATIKQAANSWFEVAGLRQAALGGAEYHAIYHQASEWAAREDPTD